MSLDNLSTIDAAGIENSTGIIILTIADSWDWIDEQSHLQALQEKINNYFAFVESSQVWEKYPDKTGVPIVVEIVCRFVIPDSAVQLIINANEVAKELNINVRHRLLENYVK